MEPTNDYLNQVVEEQARVEGELQRQLPLVAPVARARSVAGAALFKKGLQGSGEGLDQAAGPAPVQAVDYRVTGFWRWQSVVVPPNVYVVHTRRGHAEPLHVGLGISFHYNPYTDAFLLIPAAVQTLLIAARCICAERQGILVQAYVQWIVDDVSIAYRKLEFSDRADPMRIVKVQLREQAEAAIKDKVATMSIDAILSDKQPIIEELTHRLRAVAEGNRQGDPSSGLGLKIVTVQIKEAVVSSMRLWENLQKPFRAEREKLARMAELDAQQHIVRVEQLNRQAQETAGLESERQLVQLRAAQERENYDRDQSERARRHLLEQQAEQRAIAERTATERTRREAELQLALRQLELEASRQGPDLEALRRQLELERGKAEVERLRAITASEVQDAIHQGQTARAERDLALLKVRHAIENDLSEPQLKAQLIALLPEIARGLPKPDELRSVTIGPEATGNASSLVGFLASMLQIVQSTVKRPEPANGTAPV